jgi:hypothetical protein
MASTGDQNRPDVATATNGPGAGYRLIFWTPSLEWRRVFAEAWGTFLLVVVAAGGGVVATRTGGAVTLGMVVVAPVRIRTFVIRPINGINAHQWSAPIT